MKILKMMTELCSKKDLINKMNLVKVYETIISCKIIIYC